MIEVLEGLPDGVVGVEAVGEVTADNYETVLIPLFDAARAKAEHVPVLFVAGERFTGFAPGALWDDTKYGLSHVRGWGRVALVTDIAWMQHATRAFAWLIPSGLRAFPLSQRAEAEAWVAG